MEESKMVSLFVEVFDHSLTAMLTTYLKFDECHALSRVNKQFNQFVAKSANSEFIWSKQFEGEFSQKEYPDHKKEPGESAFAFFKRSFEGYQSLRAVWRQIINHTLE